MNTFKALRMRRFESLRLLFAVPSGGLFRVKYFVDDHGAALASLDPTFDDLVAFES